MAQCTELGAPEGDGPADWDVEAFFVALEEDGVLFTMRSAAKQACEKRKAVAAAGQQAQTSPQVTAQVVLTSSQEDLSASENEDWDRWTSSNTEDGASTTTCTESDWGSERDLDGQQPITKPVAGRWGFQRLVGRAVQTSSPVKSEKPLTDAMSASCESLPYLDGEGNMISMISSESGSQSGRGSEEEQGSGIEDHELDDFLAELEQNDNTEASAAAGWRLVMNKSNSTMQCCSWLRDPGFRGGSEYRGRMIVQGVSAEQARDFLLDEAHRAEWDENRVLSQQLEDWDENGCTAVRWVRRLPFFLRNREYVVARRLWNPEHRTFYCISRETNHSSAPVRANLVRVSSFYSSWRIRPVKPGCPEGTLLPPDAVPTGEQAVEIITHHEEESGLQKDIARMGVAHGMWGHLQKMGQELLGYVASGKNVKHLLPVFLIQADARLGLLGLPRPLEQHQQLQLEQYQATAKQQEEQVQ